ncbi:LytR family transcriptional attenuator [Saccharopolyspora erythraea NRRL 2338]|uniref:LCP family protein n=4 Tax=Saccharopolyspora erythraea TaxID=1836 RepID=A0ABN1CID4_SACER|nr:LCP family protein [Saccharopolyspora erythraea]PFG96741.1 LytR family transcriptional attenuator [Saccharopolyspora erythraea NRRL 2338]QRK86991.1 LCP family protein [Saccharopolyspora erythraea]CAM03036.1 probable transcriptional regulator, LytR family [Saccharopolyspora erythraea NRRL 2338]
MSDWSAGPPPKGRRPRSGDAYDYYGRGRERAAAPRPAGPPPAGPPPRRPGGPGPSDDGRRPQPPQRKPKRWGRRIGITLLVLVVLAGGLVFYFDSMLQRTDALDYPGRESKDTPGTNWLLVGSDSREGLDDSQREELSAGNAPGRRTDSMMLIHIPESGGQPAMISLPRDSSVPIPGHGRDKLNSAFSYGGPQLLAQTLEGVTGVHIDHYAEIGFGGFADLVDAVGGVDVCLDQPIKDDMAHIDLPAGCQELDGPNALGFVRARYALADGDIGRAANQRKLLGALVDKASSPATLFNPFRLVPLASSASKTFTVNNGDHVWHLASLGLAMGDLSGGQGVTTSVPFGGFGKVNGQSVILWDKERAAAMFDAIAKDQPIPPEVLDN